MRASLARFPVNSHLGRFPALALTGGHGASLGDTLFEDHNVFCDRVDTELSEADFAMSKISVDEAYGGNLLRKAIDYFCHLSIAPEFLAKIEKFDKAFPPQPSLRKLQHQPVGRTMTSGIF